MREHKIKRVGALQVASLVLGTTLLFSGCFGSMEDSGEQQPPAQRFRLEYASPSSIATSLESYTPSEIHGPDGTSVSAMPIVSYIGTGPRAFLEAAERSNVFWLDSGTGVVRVDTPCLKDAFGPRDTKCHRATITWPIETTSLPLGLFWPDLVQGRNASAIASLDFVVEKQAGALGGLVAQQGDYRYHFKRGEVAPTFIDSLSSGARWSRTLLQTGGLAPIGNQDEHGPDPEQASTTFRMFPGERRAFSGHGASAAEFLSALENQEPFVSAALAADGCVKSVTVSAGGGGETVSAFPGLMSDQVTHAVFEVFDSDHAGKRFTVAHTKHSLGGSQMAVVDEEILEDRFNCSRLPGRWGAVDAHRLAQSSFVEMLGAHAPLHGFVSRLNLGGDSSVDHQYIFVRPPPYDVQGARVLYAIHADAGSGALISADVPASSYPAFAGDGREGT